VSRAWLGRRARSRSNNPTLQEPGLDSLERVGERSDETGLVRLSCCEGLGGERRRSGGRASDASLRGVSAVLKATAELSPVSRAASLRLAA
jgi:hypothetical protein